MYFPGDQKVQSTVWLETDLEPDDVLALYILVKRRLIPRVMVVGEGNAAMKVERAKRYVELLRKEGLIPQDWNITIIMGQSSDKLFQDDGKELLHCEVKQPDKITDQPDYVKELSRFLSNSDQQHPLFVVLKPPRELVQALSTKNAASVDKCDLWIYGSFNLRCLLKDPNYNPQHIWLRQFRQTWLYESFHATGELNSVQDKVMPKLFTELRSLAKTSEYIATLFRLIGLWNKHILHEAQQDVVRHAKSDQKERLARSQKIVDSVKPYVDSQMVLADFALAAVADVPGTSRYWKPLDVVWDKAGYSAFREPDSLVKPVFVCRNIDLGSLEAVIMEAVDGDKNNGVDEDDEPLPDLEP